MGPIVVGVDGSAGSAAAVGWAAGCAQASGSDLLLVSVVAHECDAADTEVLLEGEWAQPASRAGCPTDARVVVGDPRLALPEVASDVRAMLLVVGTGSERWFPALHLGSTSHYLAHHTDRPLAVIPAGQDRYDASHIVVGVDGSAGSAAAVGWSNRLALVSGGKATAVLAWAASPARLAGASTVNSQEEADDACRRGAGLLEASGVLLGCRVRAGDPVAVLASAVDEEGAAILVLGTRGHGGFLDLRLGSVALRLLQGAAVPTVLVPPVGSFSASGRG